MDFRLTPDQEELRDGIAAWLAGEHDAATVRRLAAGEGDAAAIRTGLVSLGLPALLVPEAQGGLGLGLVEGVLAAIELGRACVNDPLVETALVAAPWLARRDESDALAAIAAGRSIVALAHPVNPWIADLDRADLVIGGGAVHRAAGFAAVPLASVDPLRRLFATKTVAADPLLLDLAALMAAAHLIGLAEAMLAMATAYAAERVQFGRPIGSFQAVKHHLADVALGIRFARPVLLRAAVALEAGDRFAAIHVSHAKRAATDAAWLAGEHAIQVHGAMGYTYEVDLHFWMKRTWALSGAWGDRAFHAARVEDAVIGGAMPIGPQHSFVTEAA